MNSQTCDQLNLLNKDFYAKIGSDFSRTRQNPWQGWTQLLPIVQRIATNEKLRVLDVGCGNGRFGVYLQEKLGKKFEYEGIDNNGFLLSEAKDSLKDLGKLARMIEADAMIDATFSVFQENKFDLIVVFGVMHHVAGFSNRVRLLKNLKNILADNGVLVVSWWKFISEAGDPSINSGQALRLHSGQALRLHSGQALRLHSGQALRLHSGQDKLQVTRKQAQIRKRLGISYDDLEEGDYFLGWDKLPNVYRYAHYVTDSEIEKLLDKTNLKMIDSYLSDGKNGQSNRYTLLMHSEH